MKKWLLCFALVPCVVAAVFFLLAGAVFLIPVWVALPKRPMP